MHSGRGIHTIIVGAGVTGFSVARYLATRGQSFAVVDSRNNPPSLRQIGDIDPAIPVYLGKFDQNLFTQCNRLIVSPGVSLAEPAIEEALRKGVEIIGDVELFAREVVDIPVAAITGSNGKSTVTMLLASMARAAKLKVLAGGNLGEPVLDLIDPSTADLYVLELSSFQLETLSSLRPIVSVVLNVSVDHMDRYRDIEEYAAIKARIYHGAKVKVVNRNDATVMQMQPGTPQISFGLDEPDEAQFGLRFKNGEAWLARGKKLLLPEAMLKITGRHNTANALAALAMGDALGFAIEPMLAALQKFTGLPHRSQWLGNYEGMNWYNDSKGTNVGATLAALQGIPGKVVLIAGGVAKGADFNLLREAVHKKARAVVLMGSDAIKIQRSIAGSAPLVRAPNMRIAVKRAAEFARTGDSVLLSPACASFDMYSNYQERGEDFMSAVEEIIA